LTIRRFRSEDDVMPSSYERSGLRGGRRRGGDALSQGHKYTLSACLRDTSADIVLGVARANWREGADAGTRRSLRPDPERLVSVQRRIEDPEAQGNVKKRQIAYRIEPLAEQEEHP
jgi:hypothetical protein